MTIPVTTDDLLLGGGLALLALRRLPGHHAARLRGWLAAAARLGLLVWLYQVTDGYAFSPFSFTQAFLGGTMWQPVLTVFGLLQVVARATGIDPGRTARRAFARRPDRAADRGPAADAAVPVPEA